MTTTPELTTRLNDIVSGIRNIYRNDSYYSAPSGILYDTKAETIALYPDPINWVNTRREKILTVFHTCKAKKTYSKNYIWGFEAPVYLHCFQKLNKKDSDIATNGVMDEINIYGLNVLKTLIDQPDNLGLNIIKWDYLGQELFPGALNTKENYINLTLQHSLNITFEMVIRNG